MHNLPILKCICTKKKLYVKGTEFRCPLHQHSEKIVHKVMKEYFIIFQPTTKLMGLKEL